MQGMVPFHRSGHIICEAVVAFHKVINVKGPNPEHGPSCYQLDYRAVGYRL